MITKLKLTNFKNFKEAEIAFGPVSILVGANATGKSNVRDALRFLHGVARGYNLAEIIGEKYGEGGQLLWAGIRGGAREVCFSGDSSFGVCVTVEREQRQDPQGWMRCRYAIKVVPGFSSSAPRVTLEQLYMQLGSPGSRSRNKDGQAPPLLVKWNEEQLVFDSHPPNDPPAQSDPMQLALRVASGANYRRMGPKLVGIANQPLLTQIVGLAERQKVAGRVKPAVDALVQELESIRFIDFSPDLMRRPSIPGQQILSDRGDNLSSVLQAICDRPELRLALSNWVQELTPMDVVGFDFVPDAAGKVLVYLVEQGQRRTSANSASDGTLRFLGMLAALLGPKPARFYFLEEIDNGIHPARLALLMDLLDGQSRSKGIQIVASTHSPQVLRLIKPANLKFATLAYRLKGSAEGRLKPLAEIPNLLEILKNRDIARLHESSWMETTMEFSEGTPTAFTIDDEEGGQ